VRTIRGTTINIEAYLSFVKRYLWSTEKRSYIKKKSRTQPSAPGTQILHRGVPLPRHVGMLERPSTVSHYTFYSSYYHVRYYAINVIITQGYVYPTCMPMLGRASIDMVGAFHAYPPKHALIGAIIQAAHLTFTAL
jgi:hypothetical protein